MKIWWQARSQRERLLLGIMCALLALVLAWLLILRPLSSAHEQAETRHDTAVHSLAETRTRIAEAGIMKGASTEPLGLPLAEFLRVSAGQAGFGNAAVDPVGGDRARLSIPAAKGPALYGWLDRLEVRGVFAEQASIRPNSDATLAFTATMRARSE